MGRITIITLFAVLVLTGVALAANLGASGDELYAQGNYQEAVAHFQSELGHEPYSARLHTNLACALYRLGRYQEAIKELHAALGLKTEAPQTARIHYNIGNCYFTTNRLDEAIESYKNALRLNPNDMLAKYNLEIALKRKDQPPPPRSSQSQSSGGNNTDENEPQQSRNNEPRSEPSRANAQKPEPQMTRDEAERILDALRQTEKGPTNRGNIQRSYFNTTIKRDW